MLLTDGAVVGESFLVLHVVVTHAEAIMVENETLDQCLFLHGQVIEIMSSGCSFQLLLI
jgi:hypothetical protein